MKQKITLLFGAGAAIPWGGQSAFQLTESIISKSSIAKTSSGKNLVQYIIDVLADYHKTESQNINFEQVLNVLELLYEFFYEKDSGNPMQFTPDWPGLFNIIADVDKEIKEDRDQAYKSTTSNKRKGYTILKAYKDVVNIIYGHIMTYSANFNNSNYNLNTKITAFINFLRPKFILRAYSLNYDNMLSEVLNYENVYNGFKLASNNEYDYSKIINNEDIDVFYNLHGSFNFDVTYSLRPTGRPRITFTKTPLNVPFNDLVVQDESKRRLIVSPIITGQQKVYYSLFEPFNAFLHAFRKDCLSSDIIIIVGYSFSDGHINDCLINGLEWNERINIINITFLDSYYSIDNPLLNNFKQVLINSGRSHLQFVENGDWLISNEDESVL